MRPPQERKWVKAKRDLKWKKKEKEVVGILQSSKCLQQKKQGQFGIAFIAMKMHFFFIGKLKPKFISTLMLENPKHPDPIDYRIDCP